MTGLGCVFNKDVREKGCEICSYQGLQSGDILDKLDICDIRDMHDMHNRPHSERIPRKLTCRVLRYGIMVQNVQRTFSNFPIIFQFSLYM